MNMIQLKIQRVPLLTQLRLTISSKCFEQLTDMIPSRQQVEWTSGAGRIKRLARLVSLPGSGWSREPTC